MKSRSTIFLLLLFVANSDLQAVQQPNIVLFLVDDLGWADMGSRQPGVFETPNMDALGKAGVDFRQAYIACPTCSPSRTALLTGKHPARMGFFRHITGGPDETYNYWETDPAHIPSRNWLPIEHVTYAEALKKLGYYNIFFGKWHLGHEAYHPIRQGFDQQVGTTDHGQPTSYYPDYFTDSNVLEDDKSKYLTDRLTDEAVGFIDAYDRGQPFMLSFWYYNVHMPHIGRKDLVRHFEEKGLTGDYAQYAAQIAAVDESIGRVREALDRKGIAKDTILIFLSDQGGTFNNPPFRGGKMQDTLYEGGARVPFFFYWPGVTRPGESNNSIVQSTDLFPTLVEIAGGDPSRYKSLDGVSLKTILEQNIILERGEPIYGYRAYEDLYASVRSGDWKLLAYRSGMLKLYNLAEDIGEKNDLAAAHPEKVADLKMKLFGWEKEMGLEKYSGVK